METIANELQNTVERYLPGLHALSEEDASVRSSPGKWSKKELIGHLIDSAQNNIRRIIVTQYGENSVINYRQDDWVDINDYQNSNLDQLIQLWHLLNIQMSNILKKTVQEKAQLLCYTPDAHSIEWLAQDYIKHLKHHIHQVLEMEPVPYP